MSSVSVDNVEQEIQQLGNDIADFLKKEETIGISWAELKQLAERYHGPALPKGRSDFEKSSYVNGLKKYLNQLMRQLLIRYIRSTNPSVNINIPPVAMNGLLSRLPASIFYCQVTIIKFLLTR